MAQLPAPFSLDDPLIKNLLLAFDQLFGLHPGFRPVHAKGAMCGGTFTPSPQAQELTRAPHAVRPSTPVIARFSDFAGVPTVPDNDPAGAGPRGFAVRFNLAEHRHTDVIGHSADGFPTRTGADFLGFARAIASSGPTALKPTPLDLFLAAHPETVHFLGIPKPIPTSFARESFFGRGALHFTNAKGVSRYGRFRIHPVAGNEYLSDADAAQKPNDFLFDELAARLAKEPVKFRIVVQIAADGDEVADSTLDWPADRPELEFGTVTLTERLDDSDPEMRRVIFDPIPRVDGIDPSADPLLEVRAALYLLSGRRRRAAKP
jgi:catalase